LPPKQRFEYQVEVGGKIRLAGCSRARRGADYKQATSRQQPQIPSGEVAQPPPNRVPDYRRAHRLAHDETHSRRLLVVLPDQQAARHQGRPALLPPRVASAKSVLCRILAAAGSMVTSRLATSDADARATLPAPGREDRTAGPGAHAQPETMGLARRRLFG